MFDVPPFMVSVPARAMLTLFALLSFLKKQNIRPDATDADGNVIVTSPPLASITSLYGDVELNVTFALRATGPERRLPAPIVTVPVKLTAVESLVITYCTHDDHEPPFLERTSVFISLVPLVPMRNHICFTLFPWPEVVIGLFDITIKYPLACGAFVSVAPEVKI